MATKMVKLTLTIEVDEKMIRQATDNFEDDVSVLAENEINGWCINSGIEVLAVKKTPAKNK